LDLTPDEWVSVLKLATIWSFAEVRATAMKNLEKHATEDPLLQIILAKQFNIREWLLPGLNGIAQRAKPLDETDWERLSSMFPDVSSASRFLLKIGQVRESFKPPLISQTTTGCFSKGHSYCHGHSQQATTYCSKGYPGSNTWLDTKRGSHNFTAAIKRIFNEELIEDTGSPDFL
jgi:hypothetical protein